MTTHERYAAPLKTLALCLIIRTLQTLGVVIGLVILALALMWAATVNTRAGDLPAHGTGPVNDFTNTLNVFDVRVLERKIDSVKDSVKVVIAIVPDMGGEEVAPYATALFNKWGIGSKKEDNGILILVAKKERKIRIEVGYGAEGTLPDLKAKEIISKMVPYLGKGEYRDAFAVAVNELASLPWKQ